MINGTAYDYENVRFSMGSIQVDLGGIKKCTYATKIDNEKIFGSAREAIDSTDGVANTDDQDWEMNWYQWQNIREAIGEGFLRKSKRFDLAVAYSHEGEDVVTDTLQRCRIKGVSNDHAQGGAGLMVTVTIEIMKVVYGDMDPMKGDN